MIITNLQKKSKPQQNLNKLLLKVTNKIYSNLIVMK